MAKVMVWRETEYIYEVPDDVARGNMNLLEWIHDNSPNIQQVSVTEETLADIEFTNRYEAEYVSTFAGHPTPYGLNSAGLLDHESGGYILYGHMDTIREIAEIKNELDTRPEG